MRLQPNNYRETTGHLVTPLPRQVAWQDLELGLVYHYDLDVFMPGGHDHERSRRECLSPELYRPDALDTDQWLEAAVAMGARYAILTATHHQGFLQWQSDLYPFGVKQAPWRNGKGDLVRDFVESCHKAHVAPGIYIGIRFNAYWQVYGYEVRGGRGGDDALRTQYMGVCERIVEELCTRYGDWCEIWFDGGVISPEQGGPDLLPIVDRSQPNAVFYHSPERAEHRWAGSETGTTEYPCWATFPDVLSQTRGHREAEWLNLLKRGDPDGSIWCPAMCDAPIREHDWLWIPNREHRLQPLDRLMTMYLRSVGHNCNLILGAVPDRQGRIPEADMQRYAEFGAAIRRRFGHPVAKTSGEGDTIVLELPTPQRIEEVILMERIEQGERVREYVIEGQVSEDRWQCLGKGSCIGHKRIQRLDPLMEVAALRLRVIRSVAQPHIREFSAHCSA